MLLTALILYPETPQLPTPGYPQLVITSTVPIAVVQYAVTQVSAATAKIGVTVTLPPGGAAGTANLTVRLPTGAAFADCHAPACTVLRQGRLTGTFWTKPLTFTSASGSFQAAAVADFRVKAHHFGVTFNGVAASAVVPQVTYQGPRKPEPVLVAGYMIPSAANYDWSSFPATGISSHSAAWQEDVPYGDTPSRVAVGINHAAQANNDTMTFLAGALVGLAGGAILSAIQEALSRFVG